MIYKEGDYIATHKEPIWRDSANFLFFINIGQDKNGNNEWEQSWGKKIGYNLISICNIPFFAYNLNLGDELEINSENIFTKKVKSSGNSTFRIFFEVEDPEIKQKIVKELVEKKILLEWSSQNLLALNVSTEDNVKSIANYLNAREQQGLLQYETGAQ